MKTLTTGFLKKCMFILGLSMLTTLSFGQIKLSQPMTPGGTFGLIDANDLKGGLMMVDSLELRDSILMYRAKKGMMVIIADAEAAAGYQTKTFMFLPSEDPTDYADGGKIWNTYDEYQVHKIADFIAKYGLDPWVEVSLGLKDPDGPGIDSLYVSSAFIDTIFSNTGDTIFLVDKAKTDSLFTDYLNLSGVQVLGISSDNSFANASNDSLATQLAVKDYIQAELTALSSNANITKLHVDTLNADSAYIIIAKIDTIVTNQLVLNDDTVKGISTDIGLGGIASSNDSISSQLAVKTYVDDSFADFGANATISNLIVDTLTVDTAFISNLLSEVIVSDSINVDTLIALYSTIDTAAISKISVDYFTLNGYWVGSISNDTTFTSADSLALITEFAVQNRIDSVMVYVNNEFSSLSQNSIENPLNAGSRIEVNQNDSLVFMVNNDTAMVIAPDGSVNVDDLVVQQLTIAGVTVGGISTDITMGGTLASNNFIATQYAVKTYVDDEVLKLSGSTSTDTLNAQVAFIGDSYIDSLNADTAKIVRLTADTLFMDSDTIYAIAKTGEVIADADLENTVVTAGYVKNNASAFPEGLNPVTRNGWTGVSGQDLDADNVVDFLKKVFFPVPEPRIASIGVAGAYSTETLASVTEPNGDLTESIATFEVPYATWKSGLSLDIAYNVMNRSVVDGDIANTNIASISIEQGTYTPAAIPGNGLPAFTGNFPTVDVADLNPAPSATANSTYTFTTTVIDAYPNENTLDWNVRLLAGQKLAITGFSITAPTLIEGDGDDKTVRFNWAINNNEDVITSINVNQELPSAATIATGSTTASSFYEYTLGVPATQGTYTYRYDLSVGSQVYGSNVVSAFNRTYIISDRHFWGYIDLTNRNTISALSNGNALDLNTIFNVTSGDVLNKNWEGSQPNAGIASGASSSNGELFTTGAAGDVYACIAIPKTSGAVELHQWDDLNKYWVKQGTDGIVVRSVTHTVGTLVKDYWIVYSTTAFSSTAAPIFRVVEK